MDKTTILRIEVAGFGEAKQDLEFLTTESDKLTQAKRQLNKESANAAKSINAEAGSIAKLRADTALLRQQVDNMRAVTSKEITTREKLIKKINENTTAIRNYDRAMSGSTTLVGEYGRGIMSSFKSMSASLVSIYAAVKAVKMVVSTISDFSSAQSNLAAIGGYTKDQMEGLTETALRLGKYSNYTATEVTNLQLELSKLGFQLNEIQLSTEPILQLATALGVDAANAANTLGVALRVFNLTAADSYKTAETLAFAANKSALNFADFETILSTVGPVAQAFNFSLTDTVALTGKLRDAGFDASSAATALRSILLNLADSNGKLAVKLGGGVDSLEELIPALVKLRDSGVDLNETLELTDVRSVAAFSQFLLAAESVGELKTTLEGANGELQAMVDKQLDNLAGDWDKLKTAFNGFILEARNGEGVLRKLVQGVNELIITFSTIGITLKRSKKMTEDDVSEFLDSVLAQPMNRLAKKIQVEVERLNEVTLETLEAEKDKFIEVANDYTTKKKALQLWEEYYSRRTEQQKLAVAAQIEGEKRIEESAKQGATVAAKTMTAVKAWTQKEFDDWNVLMAKISKQWEDVVYKFDPDVIREAVSEPLFSDEEWEAGLQKARENLSKEQDERNQRKAKYREEDVKEEKDHQDKVADIARAAFQGVQMAADTIFENKKTRLNAEMQAELNNANLTEQQKEVIRKKYAREQQKIDVKQALINTALGIGNALATVKPLVPAGLIAAGLAALQGGLQVAAIKAQKFASGGRITGGARIKPDSRGDDTLIIAKQGEVILNQRQQLALGSRSLKRAGVPGFADGGIVGGITPSAGYGGDMSAFVDRLIAGINEKQVQLVLPELNEGQRRLKMITQSGRL